MKNASVLFGVFALLMSFAEPSHAILKRPWAWTTIGHKGKIGCNFIGWYTFSASTSSESCDLIVPLVKDEKQELERFVNINHDRLMEEMSQGQGAVLADYAVLMGCSRDSVDQFSKAAQENFSTIFSGSGQAADILQNTRKTLQQNRDLRDKCTLPLS